MQEQTPPPDSRDMLARFLVHSREHAVICTDQQGTITGWLGASERIFGYVSNEALGRPLSLIFTEEDRARGVDRYERSLADVQSRAEDDRWHLRKDGTRIWVTGTLDAITDEAGQLLGYVKVVRDKTDLRAQLDQLENQLQAMAGAREKTERFLSTLGHEMRNPLGPMQNAAYIVQKLSTDPRTDRAAQVILNQVAVLARMAEDLMEVSRAGAGKMELNLQPVDLRAVLAQASDMLRPDAAAKDVRLECLMPPGDPLEAALDPQRFERVVLNLLGNAIKYTPPGGTVWVKATQEDMEVVFRVEDTGIGIAPDVLPRIFDLFTQERQASDMVPGGLGIGLTIVKELVELHGGKVQARSAGAGKGAEFTVRLPTRERAMRALQVT